MGVSFLTQKLLQKENQKSTRREVAKAKIMIWPGEAKVSFWKEWILGKKGFALKHYRLGQRRVVMV